MTSTGQTASGGTRTQPAPRRRSRAGGARRSTARRGAGPITAETAATNLVLTPEGRAELQARAESLRVGTIPSLRPLLTETERDERLVADFERALAELDRLEQVLAAAETLRSDPHAFDGRIELGARVTIEMPDGDTETVRIVHPEEAFLDDERVSATSPLAVALLGARAGHTVWVAAPRGTWPCRVVAVEAPAPAAVA